MTFLNRHIHRNRRASGAGSVYIFVLAPTASVVTQPQYCLWISVHVTDHNSCYYNPYAWFHRNDFRILQRISGKFDRYFFLVWKRFSKIFRWVHPWVYIGLHTLFPLLSHIIQTHIIQLSHIIQTHTHTHHTHVQTYTTTKTLTLFLKTWSDLAICVAFLEGSLYPAGLIDPTSLEYQPSLRDTYINNPTHSSL